MDIDKTHIKSCLELIEDKLSWGPGEKWTTKDYQNLSDKIHEETKVTLSVATLKRIWGRISYTSSPTITTMDALSQFIGYENWRAFEQNLTTSKNLKTGKKDKALSIAPLGSLTKIGVLCTLLILLGWTQFKKSEEPLKPLNPSEYQFSSRKMVTEGVPNSVIFDYDASFADDRDTIYIQQSWDERLREQVSKNDKNHSSIYYHPGYFKAKLVVRDTIMQEHDLYIKSKGWLPLVEYGGDVPVYFSEEEVIRKDGRMYISQNQFKDKNISMQPKVPWVHYYYMTEMGDINIQNFILETRIRNTYKEGAAVCQFTSVDLRFDGAFIGIPLSIKGCVSQIGLFDLNGKNRDPSKLGVDFSDWVALKLIFENGLGKLYINGDFVYDLDFSSLSNNLKGLDFTFQGSGEVDEIFLKKLDGTVVFGDTF